MKKKYIYITLLLLIILQLILVLADKGNDILQSIINVAMMAVLINDIAISRKE